MLTPIERIVSKWLVSQLLAAVGGFLLSFTGTLIAIGAVIALAIRLLH